MRAVVWHDVGDIRLDTAPEPKIEQPTDAVVRITTAAICGTDLHFIRGTAPDMRPGTILGHEGVGVVEEVGQGVRNFKPGDRVLLSAVLGCGSLRLLPGGLFRAVRQHQPELPSGGGHGLLWLPVRTGPFDGLQAEDARVPYANTNLFRLPDSVPDAQAIPLSDIYPTGYFGAVIAEVSDDDVVSVWGCGPVGQFAILSSFQRGASRVIAIDHRQEDDQHREELNRNGNHPRYIPRLLAMVESGVVDPEKVVTQHEPLRDAMAAYREFDRRSPGWLKVALDPTSQPASRPPPRSNSKSAGSSSSRARAGGPRSASRAASGPPRG